MSRWWGTWSLSGNLFQSITIHSATLQSGKPLLILAVVSLRSTLKSIGEAAMFVFRCVGCSCFIFSPSDDKCLISRVPHLISILFSFSLKLVHPVVSASLGRKGFSSPHDVLAPNPGIPGRSLSCYLPIERCPSTSQPPGVTLHFPKGLINSPPKKLSSLN